jgi:hypothetical protein
MTAPWAGGGAPGGSGAAGDSAAGGGAVVPPDGDWTWEERNLLDNVDSCLASGIAIKDWWRRADATGAITDRFDLTRVFNRPERSYSFFDVVPLPGGPLPVMGDVPWVYYDQMKGRRDVGQWTREVEEYVLRYFLRISSFRLPQAVVPADGPPPLPPPLNFLSWCPKGFVTKQGFGYRQLYYKLRGSGRIGRFSADESYAIVDQRELATRYEWVVANVQIFDFQLSFPTDPNLPRFSFPLSESQYIILSDAFVADQLDPAPGIRGFFQFGYAMLKPLHDDSVLAYGPGQFDSGFQLFTFTVGEDSVIRVRMPFVVNRPTRILDVSLDPLDWGLRAADLLTGGRAAPLLEPLHAALSGLPGRPGGFDPVFTGIDLANLFSLGLAGRLLCITKDQLEKFFLVFHFDQYYTMITGSLLTWRQIANWLDPAAIPLWVKTGRSS